MNNKEKRGIYNVTFNEKLSTPIKTDLEVIENAAIDYMVHYIKGWHNIKRDKGRGAEHIKLHLEKGSQGEITLEELLNIGNTLREYLKKFNEPFIDKNGAKIYEWENERGVKFRVVTDRHREEGHSNTPLSPSADVIITFYSDRNLNKQIAFKNPKVAQYYQNKDVQNTQDSALERMKQKIEAYAQKSFDKKNPNNKDKGSER